MNLFRADENENEIELIPTTGANELNIIKFKAEEIIQYKNWKTLFEGYTTLKVITYSSSLAMIRKVMSLFENVEIILGNEDVIGNLEEYIRDQYATISTLQTEDKKGKGDIISRIKNGTLSFYVTKLNERTSHQKLYLLSDGKEKYRTITGSANFSIHAFQSSQLENIMVSDDFHTYDLFTDIYQKTRDFSTQRLTEKTIQLISTDKIEELPAIKEVLHAKVMVLEKAGTVNQYAVKKEEFDKFVKEHDIDINRDMVKKKGIKTLITYDQVKKVTGQFKLASNEQKKQLINFPTLRVDKLDNNVYLNDAPMDLEDIEIKDIDKDIEIFEEFFRGYDDPVIGFKGSLTNNVQKYFATVNYAFCAPFLSVCRYETGGTNIEVIPYPMFLLLKGTTNGGKSMLMRFILKMCFNPYGLNIDYENGLIQKANTEGNGPAKVQQRRLMMQGFPIMLDEVTKSSWRQYGERFIKTDVIESENISPVIMATNDIAEIEEALAKRTVAFSIDLTIPRISNLTKKAAIKNMNQATGALYREYLKRMMMYLPRFLASFHDDKEKEAPDLLKMSSMILSSIFEESANRTGKKVPPYVDVYTMKYYLINANEQEVIDDFVDMYTKIGDEWEINAKANYIRIQMETKWQAKEFQNKYGLERTEIQGRNIIMKLRETEEYFGIQIGKKSFITKLKNLFD